MRSESKRRTRLEALVALVALLQLTSTFSTHNSVQAAVTQPGAPTIAAVTSLDPAKVDVCAQAGKARTKAGCGLLTVLLQPPSRTNGADLVTSHRITCVPANCPITAVRRQARRLAATATAMGRPPCPGQTQGQGAGVTVVVGKKQYLQYKLQLPLLDKYVPYKCWAVAANKAGFGAASRFKTATLPPSPPAEKPSILRITAGPSGTVVVHCKAPRTMPGNTGMLVRGRSAKGHEIRAVGDCTGGKEVQLMFKRGQYKESTVYQMSAHYINNATGPARPLLSEPAVAEYRTPSGAPTEGPPGPPAAIALSYLSADTSPVCRDAGAEGYDACTSLTITVTPPASNGNAAITQYLVVCKPPSCPSNQGRRRLHSMLDPCVYPPTAQGQGTPAPGGKLQFQLPLASFNTIPYQCNATALNKWGWGVPSAVQAFTPPTRPPASPPSISTITLDGSQAKVCLRPMLSDSMDATSFLIVGKLDDGTEVMNVTGSLTSSGGGLGGFGGGGITPPKCVTAQLGSLPNTLIRFSSSGLKTVNGITYKSKPSSKDLLTPPGVPSVTSVELVANSGALGAATMRLAPPAGTAGPLTYAVLVGGLSPGSSTQRFDASSRAQGPDGSVTLTVAAAFEAGKQYSFQAVAINAAGETLPSTPPATATATAA